MRGRSHKTMAVFHVENFGCRAARADGEAVAAHLRASGHRLTPPEAAEVVVVNTCSVTAEADRAARAFIRRTHRRNPQARIVVTGCYAQRAPAELAALPGVAAVVGNSHKALAPELISNLLDPAQPLHTPELIQIVSASTTLHQNSAPPQVLQVPLVPLVIDERFAHSFLEEEQVTPGAQTRPNLKIQEGCSNRCTFCVIPFTRGPSRSLPQAAVLKQVRGFVAAGGNELVLSGINLGRWGRDLSASSTLAALVRRIFAETALPRLRLSSIEPMDWDAELIALLAEFGSTRLARHAHLPLQSGSDAVLRRMHRRYRPWHYAEKVHALLAATGPALTLGADVMAGFPGETGDEFEETLAFLRSLPFGYLHLFPFSPRPGTPGEALHAASPVPAQVVEERMTRLRSLAHELSLAHRRQFPGQALPAITLHTPADLAACNRSSALSDNFLPIELAGSHAANTLLSVRITGISPEGILLADLR
ncbi:MAG: MiaB/RimO family radical SAM methylthiotransferase [Terracidiphilus sp.]|nr:MiaB/RimO family radical SAM methylthiotransferase [Terracidiphilus sp.]